MNHQSATLASVVYTKFSEAFFSSELNELECNFSACRLVNIFCGIFVMTSFGHLVAL